MLCSNNSAFRHGAKDPVLCEGGPAEFEVSENIFRYSDMSSNQPQPASSSLSSTRDSLIAIPSPDEAERKLRLACNWKDCKYKASNKDDGMYVFVPEFSCPLYHQNY